MLRNINQEKIIYFLELNLKYNPVVSARLSKSVAFFILSYSDSVHLLKIACFFFQFTRLINCLSKE